MTSEAKPISLDDTEAWKLYLEQSCLKTESGCWEWQRVRNQAGYGFVRLNGKIHIASRIAFVVFKGAIPDGHFVCHHCDNPPCCNPDHLFSGSNADNMRDAFEKGRVRPPKAKKGEGAFGARLTEADVLQIRALFASGMTKKELAIQFGVGWSTISNVVTRTTWSHV